LAKRCWIVKNQSEPKYKVRKVNRCQRCFRRRAFYRRFGLCRLCFRELALRGEIPGVRKATW
jgi:small subunit ribosomal protein S14